MKFLLGALGALTLVAGIGSPAKAQNYPWCAVYDMPDAPQNCGFVSFAQCMDTVRGMGGFCIVNNRYEPPAPHPSHQARKRSAHAHS